MPSLEKGSKKLLHAWAFFDWSISVYNLIISSAIFPIFYGALFRDAGIDKIAVFGGMIERAPLISYVTAAAFLVVSFITPLLAGIADYIGNKRGFMKFFTYLGALSCIGLYFFSLEYIYFGLLCYFLALVGFWTSFAFYNSYLPDIAYPEQHDALSAKGYSLGYIGSVILLLVNLVMILKFELFGFESAAAPTQISFIMVGLWWMGFAQYTFKHMPKGTKSEGSLNNVLFNGFKELKMVYNSLTDDIRLKRYLVAFFIYSMAVQTVMLVATYFGEEDINWGSGDERTQGLIVSILLIQLVAIIGATLTSKLSERIGNIQTLIYVNMVWIGICIAGYFVTTPLDFYMTAGVVGLVMGGIQALSRSTYSKFLPETEDTTSFFSFYDVAEKIGIVIGMLLYGIVAQITGSMRNSIIFLGLFFLIGMLLLFRVPRQVKA
ncbi:MFS transporter [Spongiivirga citrea]|uniref:MFS transporter n=1 Tax=Spongiivirga citrea TaxID=1481457 RepID=A0A6M0CL34_9FLAO|nr:MFS transporter [Spongiivirga citrea]NER17693.1 MFS transporter [Spongiivirga citrea]